MGFFKRRDKIIDLTRGFEPKEIHPDDDIRDLSLPVSNSSTNSNTESSSGGFFNFFGSSSVPSSTSNSESGIPTSEEAFDAREKRKRLAKRLTDMTDKMEDLSNQIYLLQQRIEVLERKTGTGRYD